jgi:hypothetical protein
MKISLVALTIFAGLAWALESPAQLCGHDTKPKEIKPCEGQCSSWAEPVFVTRYNETRTHTQTHWTAVTVPQVVRQTDTYVKVINTNTGGM